MARRPPPQQLISANLSNQQMQSAILKIDRRIDDLKKVNIRSITRGDPVITALETKLGNLISDIYGSNTLEYSKYESISTLYKGGISFAIGRSPSPISEYQDAIQIGVTEAISVLQAIKEDFQEKLQDAGFNVGTKAIKAYEGLELHPSINAAVGQLFRDGHYSNAVEDAVKVLNHMIQFKSGIDNEDGVALMQKVFSQKNPILKFNELLTDSDKNEQVGFMHLFMGAVMGLRNPRAHTIIKDDPERALEFIAFISLLAKLIDGTNKLV